MSRGMAQGQVVIVEYREEGTNDVPYMLLIKDGLVAEKD